VPVPCVGVEIADEIAAPHNEDALLAQGRKLLADLVVERRRLRLVDAKLHDRNVRLRVHVAENRHVLENCKNRTWRLSISRLRGSHMNAGAHTDEGLNAVPLHNAVFCVDCETISNSPHDACTICGSHSLTSLFRMLGGTLRSQKPQPTAEHAKTAKYNLELIAKVREIPATELSLIIESMTRLAEAGGAVESLRINVETVSHTEGALRAA